MLFNQPTRPALVSYSRRKEKKIRKEKKSLKAHEKRALISARRLSNASVTSVITPGHTVDALLPAALQVALLVEVLVVHVALVVRGCVAVVGEEALHVEKLARGLLGADFLAGFVGFAVFGDGVGEGFGAAGVQV